MFSLFQLKRKTKGRHVKLLSCLVCGEGCNLAILCVYGEDQKQKKCKTFLMVRLCWSSPFDWNLRQLHFAQHMMFHKLWFTYPTAPSGRPSSKVLRRSIITHRISANLYDIVQANTYKVLGLLLLLSLAIASTLMPIMPIVSSQSVYIIHY